MLKELEDGMLARSLLNGSQTLLSTAAKILKGGSRSNDGRTKAVCSIL